MDAAGRARRHARHPRRLPRPERRGTAAVRDLLPRSRRGPVQGDQCHRQPAGADGARSHRLSKDTVVQYGVTLPNLGVPDGVRGLTDLAAEAEAAGWDGVFIWDSVASPDWNEFFATEPLLRAEWNPWVVLAAMATATTLVRLGTIVTPLSRRRPWQ